MRSDVQGGLGGANHIEYSCLKMGRDTSDGAFFTYGFS
jgi:hypothetical protein